MLASPLREKGRGEPLRHTETPALGAEGILDGLFLASGPVPPSGHRQPSQVSQESTASGSTWRHPPSSQGALLLWMVVLLLLTHQTPLSVSSQPRLAGWLSQTSGSRGGPARRPVGANSHTPQSSFLCDASARPQGCLLGRQGVEVGTLSHFLQDRPLPGIVGGRAGSTLSHGALLSPLPG